MADLKVLIEKHERLAREYAHQETGFQYDAIRADGSHGNPNAERARQSKIAHEEVAAWLRALSSNTGRE